MRSLSRKWIWIGIGLPILILAWLAFRPEKLWINHRVNEPAPVASNAEFRPIFASHSHRLLRRRSQSNYTENERGAP